jgi:hypothetical protein
MPPALTEICYRLILKSPEPCEKLEELHDLCIKWGTVTNGLVPKGELVIEKSRRRRPHQNSILDVAER